MFGADLVRRHRSILLVIGVVAVVTATYVVLTSTGNQDLPFVTFTDGDLQRTGEFGDKRLSDPDSASFGEALESALAEIEQLKGQLSMTENSSRSQESASVTSTKEPVGYEGVARILANEAKAIFDGELVDSPWAQGAESELYLGINEQIVEKQLNINLIDVRCKTNACQVGLSFSRVPIDESAFNDEITRPAVELAHQIARDLDSVSYSGVIQIRTEFPGEPTTAQLFLFRSGSDGIFYGEETPTGAKILCMQESCMP